MVEVVRIFVVQMVESAAPASTETTAAAAAETGAAAPPTPPPTATLWTLESLQKEQVRTMPDGYTLVQAWGMQQRPK